MGESRLVLFDVDHTLMHVGKAHRNCFAKAIQDVFGHSTDIHSRDMQGKTDLQILREICKDERLDLTPEKEAELINVMVQCFPQEDLTEAVLLPGVQAILERLQKEKDVIIGLCTGNIEEIAFVKLRHFKIDEYFLLGGFGDASAVRADLVRSAKKEAERMHGTVEKVFVIGDTPGDIEAAKQAGATCIAVASGVFSKEELIKHTPEHVFNDLRDTEAVVNVILHE